MWNGGKEREPDVEGHLKLKIDLYVATILHLFAVESHFFFSLLFLFYFTTRCWNLFPFSFFENGKRGVSRFYLWKYKMKCPRLTFIQLTFDSVIMQDITDHRSKDKTKIRFFFIRIFFFFKILIETLSLGRTYWHTHSTTFQIFLRTKLPTKESYSSCSSIIYFFT